MVDTLVVTDTFSFSPLGIQENTSTFTVLNGIVQNIQTGCLVSEYFKEGRPVSKTLCSTINWTSPSFSSENSTTRISGWIKPINIEKTRFFVTSTDLVSFQIGSEVILSNSIPQPKSTFSGFYNFTSLDYVPIKLVWKMLTLPSNLLLEWSSISFSREIVPSSAFAMSADGNGLLDDIFCDTLRTTELSSNNISVNTLVASSANISKTLKIGTASTNYTIDYTGGVSNSLDVIPSSGTSCLSLVSDDKSMLVLNGATIENSNLGTTFSSDSTVIFNVLGEPKLVIGSTLQTPLSFSCKEATIDGILSSNDLMVSEVSTLNKVTISDLSISSSCNIGGLSILPRGEDTFVSFDSSLTDNGWESRGNCFQISKQSNILAFNVSDSSPVNWSTVLHLDVLGNLVYGGNQSIFGSTKRGLFTVGGSGMNLLDGVGVSFDGSNVFLGSRDDRFGFKQDDSNVLSWSSLDLAISRDVSIVGSLDISNDLTLCGNLFLQNNMECPYITTLGLQVKGNSLLDTIVCTSLSTDTISSGLLLFSNKFGPPTKTVTSDGTKLVLFPSLSNSTCDFAIGVDQGTLWHSVQDQTCKFSWYSADIPIAELNSTQFIFRDQALLGIDEWKNGKLSLLGDQPSIILGNWSFQVGSTGSLTLGSLTFQENGDFSTNGYLRCNGLTTNRIHAEGGVTSTNFSLDERLFAFTRDNVTVVQGTGEAFMQLGSGVLINTLDFSISNMMLVNTNGMDVQGNVRIGKDASISGALTSTSVMSGIASFGETTVSKLTAPEIIIAGTRISGNSDFLEVSGNLQSGDFKSLGQITATNISSLTVSTETSIIGNVLTKTIVNSSKVSSAWYILGNVNEIFHVKIVEKSATTSVHVTTPPLYSKIGISKCQILFILGSVYLEVPTGTTCFLTLSGSSLAEFVGRSQPDGEVSFTTLSETNIDGQFLELVSTNLVTDTLKSTSLITGDVSCSGKFDVSSALSVSTSDNVIFSVTNEQLLFTGQTILSSANFGTETEPLGDVYSSSTTTEKLLSHEAKLGTVKVEQISIGDLLLDTTGGVFSLNTDVNFKSANVETLQSNSLTISGSRDLETEQNISFSVFNIPVLTGVLPLPDSSTVEIKGAPTLDSCALKVTSGRVQLNGDCNIKGNSVFQSVEALSLRTNLLEGDCLRIRSLKVNFTGDVHALNLESTNIISSSLATNFITGGSLLSLTADLVSIGKAKISDDTFSFGDNFSIGLSGQVNLNKVHCSELNANHINLSSPSRIDSIGTSVTSGGLVIAVATAPYTIDTDVMDKNRSLSLLSDTGAVSLCMRNLSASSWWDFIVEDTGDKRLLFQETRSDGISKSWFSIDALTGQTRIEGPALLKNTIVDGSLQVRSSLDQITFKAGNVTNVFCNASNSSDSQIGLSLQNDTLGGGLLFLNSSNKVVDGGANCLTLRNNIGNLRLHSKGAGLTIVSGGAVFDGIIPVSILSTTESTTSNEGALSVAGGLGIGKSIHLGGNIIPSTTGCTLGTAENKFETIYLTSQPVVESTQIHKSNIKEIDCAMDTINKVKAYTFNSRGKEESSFGFIAEEMSKAVQGTCVVENIGIRYAELVPLLWKALQEQQEEINNLKSRF